MPYQLAGIKLLIINIHSLALSNKSVKANAKITMARLYSLLRRVATKIFDSLLTITRRAIYILCI